MVQYICGHIPTLYMIIFPYRHLRILIRLNKRKCLWNAYFLVVIDRLPTQQSMATKVSIAELLSMHLILWNLNSFSSIASLRIYYNVIKFYITSNFRSNTQIETLSINLVKHCATIGKDETVDLTLMTSIETLFRSLACLNGSFLQQSNNAHMCCTMKNHGINMADAEIAFGYIRKLENLSLKSIVRVLSPF